MNKLHHHLTEVEVTAWVLIAIFVAVLLISSYLVWRRLSPDMPQASQSEELVKVALYSEPRLVIMRPNGPELTLGSDGLFYGTPGTPAATSDTAAPSSKWTLAVH